MDCILSLFALNIFSCRFTFSDALQHDKLTGYSTKETYMIKLVSRLPFAAHKDLLECLAETEAIYKLLTGSVSNEGRVSCIRDHENYNVASAIIGLSKAMPKSRSNVAGEGPPRKRAKAT